MKYIAIIIVTALVASFRAELCIESKDQHSIIIEVIGNSSFCKEKTGFNKTWQCGTLLQALSMNSRISLNGGCIQIMEFISTLDGISTLQNIHKLTITSKYAYKDHATIECDDKNSGLSFINSSGITISNVKFEKCGRLQATIFPNQKPVNLTTVLYFENVKDITLISVAFLHHRGYAVVMTDCSSEISVLNLYAIKNRPWTFHPFNHTGKSHYYGGGILFQHVSENTLFETQVTIDELEMHYLSATNLSAAENVTDKHIPAGYGGALCIILKNSELSTINLGPLVLTNNKAFHGGAMYLEHRKKSRNNFIHIYSALMDSNTAIMSGGGLELLNYQYPHTNNNSLIIDNSNFGSNKAQNLFGGAISIRQKLGAGSRPESFDLKFVKTFINNLQEVRQNDAILGAAFFFEDVFVKLENFFIKYNNPIFSKINGFAAVYCYKTDLVTNDVTLYENNETAIVLDYSILHVQGPLNFQNNRGANGAGMALFDESRIDITHPSASMIFINNKANRGGGLYVQLSGPFAGVCKSRVYDCFFEVKDNNKTQVYFHNNHGNEGEGDDIYSSTLKPCLKSNNEELTQVFRDDNWPQFKFTANDSITTEPQSINITDDPWVIYSGIPFKAPIRLLDETEQEVSAVVKMEIRSTDVQEKNSYQEFIVEKNTIEFTLQVQRKRVSFDLVFSTSSGVVLPKTKRVQIDHCPFAYRYEQTRMNEKNFYECRCNTRFNQRRGIAECRSPNEIYVYANLWYKPQPGNEDIKDDKENLIQCPQKYCRICDNESQGENKVICRFNSLNQCSGGRGDMLCSKCIGDKSVNWGSEDCLQGVDPTWKIVVYPILIFILIVIIVGVLIVANIDGYLLYLNSFFYFYQVIELFFTTTMVPKQLAKTIIAVINFQGFGTNSKILSFPGFNDMYKPIPNLVLIVFIVLALMFFISTSSLEKLFDYLSTSVLERWFGKYINFQVMKENNYRAIVLIILYLHGSLVKISFWALHPVQINKEWYVYYYADNRYADHRRHIYIVVGYVIVSLFVILLPFYLWLNDTKLISNSCERLYKSTSNVCNLFKAPFRDDRYSQFFSIYYLLCRILLNLVSVLMTIFNVSSKQTILTVLTCISIVIMLLFVLKKPYKKHLGQEHIFLNLWDTLILFLICLIGVISNSKQKVSSFDPTDKTLENIIQWLILIPFFLVILINILRLGWKLRKMSSFNTTHNKVESIVRLLILLPFYCVIVINLFYLGFKSLVNKLFDKKSDVSGDQNNQDQADPIEQSIPNRDTQCLIKPDDKKKGPHSERTPRNPLIATRAIRAHGYQTL